jgi:choline kinase
MKALILAAGIGSRLKQKTYSIPKPLIKLNKRPILHYQLKILEKNFIKNIFIVVGYKKKKIVDYIKKNFSHLQITIIENKKYKTTDSSYSYYLAKKFLYNKDYIHLNCDIYFTNKVISFLLRSKKKDLVCTQRVGKLRDNIHLINSNKSLIINYKNFFFNNKHEKVFGIGKFSAKICSQLFNNIEKKISKKIYNLNCFSFLSQIVKKNKIYKKTFSNKDLYEINTLNDLIKLDKRNIKSL